MNNQSAVQALAAADFSDIADSFANAGFQVRLPAKGIMQITSGAEGRRLRLLLSVGIHGDETAPIEVLAQLLHGLAQEPNALQLDLMAVVGNLEAVAQGRRFIETDLNRMFTHERGELQTTAEAMRADAIMRATAAFFGGKGNDGGEKWHLDLHTAIRPSDYPIFAVMPNVIDSRRKQALTSWLGGAGIGAIILNSLMSPTYSAYTATEFGAASCTVELGQIAALGQNDLSRFALTSAATDMMLRSGDMLAFRNKLPKVFHVVQELIKRSDDFQLSFDRDTQNFTPLEPGTVIAQDALGVYRVGPITEYVVFPNSDVKIGQRAGLMVVRRG